MICFLSFYRFNYRFEPFYLLTFHIIEHTLHLGCFHGGVGIAFSHIYASDISSGKSSFLAQKSQYVALANLVFFAFTYIYGGHQGLGRKRQIVGQAYCLQVLWHKIWQVLFGSEDEIGIAAVFPSCRASYAVHIAVVVDGQMIMYDIVDVGNIESSRSKVGAARSVATRMFADPLLNL